MIRPGSPRPSNAWRALAILALASLLWLGPAACTRHKAYLEPADAGRDYGLQGEYAAEEAAEAVQVVAEGQGAFRAVYFRGGLPGAGWDGSARRESVGRRDGEGARFEDGSTIAEAVFRGSAADGSALALPRTIRRSPTLGATPPPGALVLFGQGVNATDGETDGRGLLAAGATTKARFQDMQLHLEFRTPFMPTARGQARGNSGAYLQNRYEVQILDSFGLSGEWNECGGLYKVRKPTLNMAFPPLSWQSYDIDFRAARFDAAGRKTAPARISVRHNGVSIHEDVVLPDKTGGGNEESPEPGPLYLQDHWDPVFFRNVWLVKGP